MGADTHGLLHRAHRPAGHQAQQDRRERHRHHRALYLSRLLRLAQAVASERAMRQARHDHRSGQVLQLRVPLHHQHEGESPQQAPACEEGELEAAAHRPPEAARRRGDRLPDEAGHPARDGEEGGRLFGTPRHRRHRAPLPRLHLPGGHEGGEHPVQDHRQAVCHGARLRDHPLEHRCLYR